MGRNGTVVVQSQSAQTTDCRDLRDDKRRRVREVTEGMWNSVPFELGIDLEVRASVSSEHRALMTERRIRS